MREAVRQLALEAAEVVRDKNRGFYTRMSAMFVIVLAAQPFAAAALVAIAILTYNVNKQHEMCVKADEEAREERKEIAVTSARERAGLEERMALREEKNVARVTTLLVSLNHSVDRVTEAVQGKRFIPQPPATKKAEEKKSP